MFFLCILFLKTVNILHHADRLKICCSAILAIDSPVVRTNIHIDLSEKALVREIKELLAVKEMTIEDFEKTAKDKLENLSVERLEKGLEWLKKQ